MSNFTKEPAYPNYSEADGEGYCNKPGMSRLEEYAKVAMQSYFVMGISENRSNDEIARECFRIAKAMCKEAEKRLK